MSYRLMQAEHGFGSETYDFTEILVKIDNRGRIIKRYYLTKLHLIIFMIFRIDWSTAYYGFGYDCRDKLYSDLKNKQISSELQEGSR